MLRDDAADDGEAHARTFRARAQPLEELERVASARRRDAGPVVVERHHDAIVARAPGHAELARAMLRRVPHDLEHRVVEETTIGADARQVLDPHVEGRGG